MFIVNANGNRIINLNHCTEVFISEMHEEYYIMKMPEDSAE